MGIFQFPKLSQLTELGTLKKKAEKEEGMMSLRKVSVIMS